MIDKKQLTHNNIKTNNTTINVLLLCNSLKKISFYCCCYFAEDLE